MKLLNPDTMYNIQPFQGWLINYTSFHGLSPMATDIIPRRGI
jgi:hypothetical protein